MRGVREKIPAEICEEWFEPVSLNAGSALTSMLKHLRIEGCAVSSFCNTLRSQHSSSERKYINFFKNLLHHFEQPFKKWEQPPSGVSAMSWARNCPNCIAMWDNFSLCPLPGSFSHLLHSSPHLCILVDTSRGLMSTCEISDLTI